MTNNSIIQGQLTNAFMRGGDRAIWNIARGNGPVAEKAREVIEISTSPLNDISIYQAIGMVCSKTNQGGQIL